MVRHTAHVIICNPIVLTYEWVSRRALWHRKHHKVVCDTWLAELRKADRKRCIMVSITLRCVVDVAGISRWSLNSTKLVALRSRTVCFLTRANRKLAFLFLANDIVQNSRKKGPEFTESFARVLPAATNHVVKHGACACLAGTIKATRDSTAVHPQRCSQNRSSRCDKQNRETAVPAGRCGFLSYVPLRLAP